VRTVLLAMIAAAAALHAAPARAQSLDYEFFKARVEPILLKKKPGHTRCYVCHGGEQQRFPLGEAPAGSQVLDRGTVPPQFETVSRLVVPGNSPRAAFCSLPLAPEAGGNAFHNGGRQFESKDDADWKTLAQWANGEAGKSRNSRGCPKESRTTQVGNGCLAPRRGVTHFTQLRKRHFLPGPDLVSSAHGFSERFRTADRRLIGALATVAGGARSAAHLLAQGNEGARARPADHEEDPARARDRRFRSAGRCGGGRVCAIAILRVAARRRPGFLARRSPVQALRDQRDRNAAGAGPARTSASRSRPVPAVPTAQRLGEERRDRDVVVGPCLQVVPGARLECTERSAVRVTVCATVAGVGDRQEVQLYVRAEDSKQPWQEARVQAGQDAGRRAFGKTHRAPRRDAKQVCQRFANWSGENRASRTLSSNTHFERSLTERRAESLLGTHMPPSRNLLIANVAVFLLQSRAAGCWRNGSRCGRPDTILDLAARHVRFPARRDRAHLLQHARAVHVRERHRAALRFALLPFLLFCLPRRGLRSPSWWSPEYELERAERITEDTRPASEWRAKISMTMRARTIHPRRSGSVEPARGAQLGRAARQRRGDTSWVSAAATRQAK